MKHLILRMNNLVKTKEEIELLREGGKRLGVILESAAGRVTPGVTTAELNSYAEELIREGGDIPAFLNYTPHGSDRPYPAALCVSVNDEIVHGIPNEDPITLKEGDIVGLDIGLTHKGMIVDTAVTVPVGAVSSDVQELLNVTKKSLTVGMDVIKAGAHVGDIGHAIESFVDGRYGIVEELGGHGVGREVHEDPMIPNFGKKGTGEKLIAGMVIALEPMLNLGTKQIDLADDGYTFKTADGKKSAHFEHTVLVTEDGYEVLTTRPSEK